MVSWLTTLRSFMLNTLPLESDEVMLNSILASSLYFITL